MRRPITTLRLILFPVIILVVISCIYWGFNIFIDWLLYGLGYLQTNMNGFLFWLTFMFFGVSAISILWAVFKGLSSIIMAVFAKISPSKTYGAWVVMIIAGINTILCIWSFWHNNGWPNLTTGIVGLIVSSMAITLAKMLTNVTYKFLKSYEPGYSELPTDDLYNQLEILDGADADNLTDEQINALKIIYKDPEMSKQEAEYHYRKINKQ